MFSTPFSRAVPPDVVDVWAARAALAFAARTGRTTNLVSVVSILELAGARTPSAPRCARILRAFTKRRPREGNLLVANARQLGARLHLSSLECDLVAFAAAVNAYSALDDAITGIERAPFAIAVRVIADALGADAAEVARAITSGALVTTGLLRFDATDRVALKLDPTIASVLAFPAAQPDALLAPFFRRASAAVLARTDYAHLEAQVALAVGLLRGASRAGGATRGVNVLLYGPPGTGKSQLARIVALGAGLDAFEVPVDGVGGRARSGDERLVAYKLCQRVLAETRGAAIVFDEIEDVWQRTLTAVTHSLKGSTNRVLEENPVPAIWISNEVEHLDPAFVRRFDLVVEVRVPPRAHKRALVERALPQLGAEARERLATSRDVSPAMITRVARTLALAERGARDGANHGANHDARASTPDVPAWDLDARANVIVDGTLTAMGRRARTTRIDGGYDLAFVECDADLAHVTAQLARTPLLRALLVGPPGTGKTAFVRHLADAIGRPLLEKRASDLLDCYVGNTEKLITEAFRDARDEGAVLFFDEIDGMLANRGEATHSWEVTQVNQILVDMEDFDGIFFASTNLVDRVDAAAMRRFELRVQFAPMRLERRVRAVHALLAQVCPDAARAETDAALALARDVHGLCLGDLAAVRRRARWLAREERALAPIDVVTELAREVAGKRGSVKPLGFTSHTTTTRPRA